MQEKFYQLYLQTMADLKAGKRPQLSFAPQEHTELAALLLTYYVRQKVQNKVQGQDKVPDQDQGLEQNQDLDQDQNQEQQIHWILCILDFTRPAGSYYEEGLMAILSNPTHWGEQTLIYALAATHHHLLQERRKRGERFPAEFVQILRQLLGQRNGEVVEWVMRTVELLGGQGMVLREEVQRQSRRPSYLFTFNKHKKSALKMMQEWLKRWGK